MPDELKDQAEDIGGMQPLVVPPVLAKDPYFINDMLHEQWLVAGDAAAGVDRLFLIGYSLPTSDQLMRFFLAGTVAPKIVIPVNIDAAICDAAKEVFPDAELDARFVGLSNVIPTFVQWYLSD